MSEEYVIYLRKSRVDTEYGEAETLLRHEKVLTELAKQRNLNVTAIYRELVSADTIAARPVMQQLLSEVERGRWDGVIVIEVERLARGDTIDQGIVSQSFKYSDTKIITPMKTYDPANEFDEEYFEFGLFMSRREYKTINRRLQRGRMTSVKQGNYLGSIAPYGYNKVKHNHSYTLEINQSEADTVRMIFDLYVNKNYGASKIVNHLNRLNIPTRNGGLWNTGTVRGIIENPVYIGKIRWNHRKTIKSMDNGTLVSSRPRNDDVILIDGIHPAIVSEEIFNEAQSIRTSHKITPVKNNSSSVVNPLSGLVVCADCGHKLVRRPYPDRQDGLICQYSACNNVSTDLDVVEKRIIDALKSWVNDYKLDLKNNPRKENDTDKIKIQKSIENEIAELNKQLSKVYDFLEKEIYDTQTFLERSSELKRRIEELKTENQKVKSEISEIQKKAEAEINIIPKVEKIISTYYETESPEEKNYMLKQVLEKVEYKKEKSGRWGNPEDFNIKLFFLLPKD